MRIRSDPFVNRMKQSIAMTLVVLVAVIFVLDYACAKGVLFLFQTPK